VKNSSITENYFYFFQNHSVKHPELDFEELSSPSVSSNLDLIQEKKRFKKIKESVSSIAEKSKISELFEKNSKHQSQHILSFKSFQELTITCIKLAPHFSNFKILKVVPGCSRLVLNCSRRLNFYNKNFRGKSKKTIF